MGSFVRVGTFFGAALIAAGCAGKPAPDAVIGERILQLDLPEEMALGVQVPITASRITVDADTGARTVTDVTLRVSWSSSDATIATVEDGGVLVAHRRGATTITGQQGGLEASGDVNVGNAMDAIVTVTPGLERLGLGDEVTFRATLERTDGSTTNITASAFWSSSSPGVASVEQGGVVRAVSPGRTRITARASASRLIGFADVRVTAWTADTGLEANASDTGDPRVDMNASDRAVALWVDHVAEGGNVWASVREPGRAWGPAELVSTDEALDPSSPDVAVDDTGRAVASWVAGGAVWLARRSASGTWSAPVAPAVGQAPDASAAVDDALVAWVNGGGVRACRASPDGDGDGAWDEPVEVMEGSFERVRAHLADRVGIAVAQAGDGLVSAWLDDGEWQEPRRLAPPSGAPIAFGLGLGLRGETVVAWMTGDGEAWASRALALADWSPPEALAAARGGWVETPSVAMDDLGDGVVALTAAVDPVREIWVARFGAEGWRDAVALDLEAALPAAPSVACDASGSPTIVWRGTEDEERPSVYASTQAPDGRWRERQPVEDLLNATAGPPALDAGTGSTVVTWRAATEDVGNIWAAACE